MGIPNYEYPEHHVPRLEDHPCDPPPHAVGKIAHQPIVPPVIPSYSMLPDTHVYPYPYDTNFRMDLGRAEFAPPMGENPLLLPPTGRDEIRHVFLMNAWLAARREIERLTKRETELLFLLAQKADDAPYPA